MSCEICGKKLWPFWNTLPVQYEKKDYYKECTAPDGNKFELLDHTKYYHTKCLKGNCK